MSGDVLLRVDAVARAFGEFHIGPLSLALTRGEYWVLLGPSGCGKSLLLETLVGFHRPDRGRVILDGRDATGDPPERRNVGLVFQRAALFPHRSVLDNIGYGLEALRGLSKGERARRVEEIIEAMDLRPLLGRPVSALSGGEAQRVAIARAVAPRPRVLLMDEPLALLDHNLRLELQALLARWHRDLGLTTLHVTHSREEALAVGTHAAVMAAGTLLQAGSTSDVFEHPRCPFVARFLGRPEASATETTCAEPCQVRAGRCRAPPS